MVLITDENDGGGSSPGKIKRIQHSKITGTTAQVYPTITEEPLDIANDHDEYLGSYLSVCDEEDYEEYDQFSTLPDKKSVISDDSFYPPDSDFADSERTPSPASPQTLSFFQACCNNNADAIKIKIRQGVTKEQVLETDKNSRTGLMVACYHGYMDVVIALSQCPHLDVNWQDTEGNTALITAAQAGHATITNYLLNYFSGLDIEKSNCHGFTALMKAAMQGRVDCVRALIMAGADLQARDDGRSLTPREWALFTGRYETAFVMQQLNQQPCPEQCRESYRPEWPLLPALVDNAQRPKGCIQKISEVLRNVFNVGNVTEARKDGVLDHMVHVTTALGSPFVAVACRTVCPGSPPCVGKRRYSVQEILKQERLQSMKDFGPANPDNPCVLLGPKSPDWCTGLQLCTTCDPDKACPPAPRRSPLHRVRRSSVQPGLMLPKLRISRAPTPTYKPEPERKKNGGRSGQFLQVPKWRYKELKEERKKAEEAERKRLEVVTRRHLHSGKRK
ncbi:ankyrin repeat domain-containing protein 33B [Electrophorus electricus]|uniref:Ankyrin repeat domain 33ba n=1 Tax=Electrophorus electricus TaxID=8005 RepID=A0A4W4F1N3_ELEEL|nr:ankyrin repeat domain-containing protein 33B [Electrophorus electricus]